MADLTWNELTAGQQVYLDTLVRAALAGHKWVKTEGEEAFDINDYFVLAENGLAVNDYEGVCDRVTANGFLVWQQGQPPAEPDELTRLREQVAALTAERDALVQAGNAVLDEVTVNKRGFISVAIGATVHSWNKSTGMGRALFALREVLIASAKKRTGNE